MYLSLTSAWPRAPNAAQRTGLARSSRELILEIPCNTSRIVFDLTLADEYVTHSFSPARVAEVAGLFNIRKDLENTNEMCAPAARTLRGDSSTLYPGRSAVQKHN